MPVTLTSPVSVAAVPANQSVLQVVEFTCPLRSSRIDIMLAVVDGANLRDIGQVSVLDLAEPRTFSLAGGLTLTSPAGNHYAASKARNSAGANDYERTKAGLYSSLAEAFPALAGIVS